MHRSRVRVGTHRRTIRDMRAREISLDVDVMCEGCASCSTHLRAHRRRDARGRGRGFENGGDRGRWIRSRRRARAVAKCGRETRVWCACASEWASNRVWVLRRRYFCALYSVSLTAVWRMDATGKSPVSTLRPSHA